MLTKGQRYLTRLLFFINRIDVLLPISVLLALQVLDLLQLSPTIINSVPNNPRNHSEYTCFVLYFSVAHPDKKVFGLRIMELHSSHVCKGLNVQDSYTGYS